MNDGYNEGIAIILRSALSMLAMIDTDELEAHYNASRESRQRANSVGAMLDPTAYRNLLQSGEYDNVVYQEEIVGHLLAARKAIDKREKGLAKYRKSKTE